jgi:hypothetical protein
MANDTGSNYFFIPGGEAPAPPVAPPPVTEPVSPFEKYLMALENLQPPVEFFPNSYQEPSAPAFIPMAAPAAVRVSPPATPTETASPFEKYLMDLENLQPPVEFKPGSYQETSTPAFTPMAAPAAVQVSPASKFGPVTASGYAIPPVDPMSYYSDQDLSNPQTLNQEQLNPEAEQLSASTSATTIMDPISGLPIEVVPNPDFVEPRVVPNPPRLGLPPIPPGMLDPVMDYDQWKYVDRYIRKPDKPTTPTEDENVKNLTDEEVKNLVGNQTPTPPVPPQDDIPRLAPESVTTSGLPTIVKPRPVVVVPKPNLNLPEPPKYTDTARNPGRIIPFKMPTEVPIPARRAAELLAPGYFKDINYDPDEILAAAMRVIRGRGAGRSLME